MKLGIIGLANAGKKTVFEVLTHSEINESAKEELRIATINVPDKRLDILDTLYSPRKKVPAQIEFLLPNVKQVSTGISPERMALNQVRSCDALVHVIKNFEQFEGEKNNLMDGFLSLDQELIIDDLVVIEKRIERLALDKKRGKNISAEEMELLLSCQNRLENEQPLRKFADLATSKLLKGFTLLSAKPMLLLFNNDDDDSTLPDSIKDEEGIQLKDCIAIQGQIEHEIMQMTDSESDSFLKEYQISQLARDVVIKKSYDILGCISFFTVGEDEVRAWTIQKGTPAVDAARVIHSDIQKGFIRAEVVAYQDLMDAGDMKGAKKKGTVRLEGKTYEVKDGDIINFRFNV